MLIKRMIFVLCVMVSSGVMAQDEPQNLDQRFNEIKKESYDHNEYEVIKKTRLNAFWRIVQDSVENLEVNLQNAKNTIQDQQAEIKGINETLAETRSNLEESEYASSRISVLGIYVLKSTFLTTISVIIGSLLVLLGFIGIKFRTNEKVTSRKKRDYQELADEFEEYRKIVRQREIKLKRELQTERNKIEELKHKIK